MPEPHRFKTGMFNWVELITTDVEGAKRFYGALFGWSSDESPAGQAGTYTLLRLAGRDVGGMYEMGSELRERGELPHWNTYVWVEDVDARARQVEPLGGKLLVPPFDVLDVGRMCLVQDPTGAVLHLWAQRRHPGAGVMGEPGSLCWATLLTRDAAAATAFYTRLLGWGARVDEQGPVRYTELLVDGEVVGGMRALDPEREDVPSHWTPYFAVASCDEAAERVRQQGGALKVPPRDIPGACRFTVAQDPQGATFALIQFLAGAGG